MTKTFARKLKIPYSLQNKTALCEISPKENSRYKQGCVNFYVVIT